MTRVAIHQSCILRFTSKRKVDSAEPLIIALPMPIRISNTTLFVGQFFETSSVCLRCARRIARLCQPPSRRAYGTGVRIQQGAAAALKQNDIDRRFFWANAFHEKGKYGEESVLSRVASSAHGGFLRSDTTAGAAAAEVHETPHLAATEEPAHRRRRRLKPTVSARPAVTESGTGMNGISNGSSDTHQHELPPDASSTLSRTAAAAPARSLRRAMSSYLALSKPRLAFLIVLTTTASYSIYPVPTLLSTNVTSAPSLSTLTLLFLTSGTFLCIASANTLNMLFEPQHDAKMSRTRGRPLVRGLVSKRSALLFAVITGLSGTLLLWYGVNPTTAVLGAGNIALYAFVYTPLKRIHPINTWIGAVVGAIPPLMGWCAAGSQYITSARADQSSTLFSFLLAESADLLFTPTATGGWLLAALLFAWQFPHFFALSHGVRHEYAHAGYKMLTSTNVPMAARVSLRYSLAMFPICAALSWYEVTDPSFAVVSCGVNGWMVREAWRMWRLNGEKGSARALFWASVWQLPIVLVLGMVLKKGLWERLWGAIFGEGNDEDEILMDD